MSRSSSNMSSGIGGLTKSGELRQRIFFIVFALIVFRLGSFITLPGIDPSVMKFLFEQQRKQHIYIYINQTWQPKVIVSYMFVYCI